MNPTGRMDRVLALSCDRALAGLDAEAQAELSTLLQPGVHVDPGLELAAAAITLAETTIDEPLPRHLAERALAAIAYGVPPLSVGHSGTVQIPSQVRRISQAAQENQSVSPGQSAQLPQREPYPVVPIASARRRSVVPWLVAAACFGMAAGSLSYAFRLMRFDQPLAQPSAVPIEQDVARPSSAEARARLLTEAADVVRVAWSETEDSAGKGETGEVVWSPARQEGYMTFRTVAKNDPLKQQYQLWIFDAERDERYPVDGGLFDVDTSLGEVTIPITAKVAVAKPTLFAVTVEKPGGVVVSKRERIVVVAKTAS